MNDSGLASEFSRRVAVGDETASWIAAEIFSDFIAMLWAGPGAVTAITLVAEGASSVRSLGSGGADEFAGRVKTIGGDKAKFSRDESGSILCGGTRS